MEKKTDKKKAKAMEEELQWIRQGAKGRQAKSKARIARFENMQVCIRVHLGIARSLLN